ncbi:MAG: non-ribosomal peptide synthase/polyketide synthase [Longimicrobiaceae bacterium]
MPIPRAASSLVDLLRFRADEDPAGCAYTFLLNGETEEGHVTYGELDLRARAIAARLQALGARGERALLLYSPGLEYVAALLGCFYAGVVAVPAYPPRRNKPDPRLRSIVADCAPALALTTRELLGEAERLCAGTPELGGLRWLATEDVPAHEADAWTDPEASGDTLAFLQYTSGSTAAPKGVMVGHGNLLHNFAVIEELCGYTPRTRSVIWLPPYHDMGLIGGILQPLFTGYWAALFSPVAFIQRPARWLEAVSRYRATSSGGPNFAYDLCVRAVRPEERAGLDLSRWEIAFNGAEPVRDETLRAFAEAFAPCGFRERAFYPCYGLAEATLMVTGSRPAETPVVRAVDPKALGEGRVLGAEPEGRYRLVGSGRSAPSQRVLIVDPATLRERPADRVGEVWVAGPSVARGYWGRAEETAETFGALEAGTGEGPFLRTGDLGFLDGGELFVTGRLKDLIVIRGRNHYPQDVEQTAIRSHPGLRAGLGAAFGVEEGGEERLVVVHEVSRQAAAGMDVEEVGEAIRRAVATEHGVQVHAVAVVRPGGVPRTSSGKVQRRACRARFLAGELPLVGVSVREDAGSAAPRPASAGITREALEAAGPGERQALLEEFLVEGAARVLGVDPARVDRERPLVGQGMDSLRAMELKGALDASLGTAVAVASLLDDAGIERLAVDLLQAMFLADAAPPVPAAAAEGDAPLSFAQERLWFLDRLQPGSAAYNLAGALRLRGALDAAALRRSLAETARRHEVLRTAFPEAGGRPVQRVLASVQHPLPGVDLSRLDPSGRAGEARRVAEATARTPFDLAAGPPFRARLLRLGRGEHLLVLAMHHIASDGWSTGVVLRELAALYGAFAAGAPSPLAPLRARYADLAVRERERLRGEEADGEVAYWRGRLAGLAPLELPTTRPRPAVQSFRGATHRFRVPAERTAALAALGRGEGATLHMTLLAVFAALLARYTGAEDVAVGSPVANRDTEEARALVGLFVNTVVLRVDLSGDPSFRELLRRVRAASLEAYSHAGLPFEKLVEALRPARDPGRNPLFQVMFALQDRAADPGSAGGVSLELEPVDTGTSKLDLTLFLAEERGGALSAALEYATDLFDARAAAALAGHFGEVLASAVRDPGTRVSGLGLLTPGERARILAEWNDTGRAVPPACVHDLFTAQAARTPEAVAATAAGETLTYAGLERRSAALARLLRERGVGPEVRVGVCLERGTGLLVGLLGVLRAGGAYVPLDPSYPRERLAYVLDDARVPVLLTGAGLAAALPAHGADVVLLEEADEGGEGTLPDGGAVAANAAYVIYTSGSTGRPKGVVVPHGSVVNLLAAMERELAAGPADVLLAVTPLSFDISVLELFLPLAVGAVVAVADAATASDGARLRGAVAELRPTLMQATPATWQMLLEAGWEGSPGLGILCGGEALAPGLAARLRARGERLWNVYGPTETTIWSTAERMADGGPVTVGRPLANTRVYVLDRDGGPVPAGVPGELFIGGRGVARGYLDRPELTAERFVPDPFGAEPGGRLYATGDLARFLADGRIEHLGRADDQVKVRGFRIEPGEVESALAGHPGVLRAVVAARDDRAGGKRLVAYVVPAAEAAPSPAELRAWLRRTLPEHMVPGVVVTLDRLPLTPAGKTDRRALPEPEAGAAGEAEHAPPSTPVQEILAGIWGEVLETGSVGAADDFFALGGHSLLGTRVVARVRDALGVELPLRALFEAPTLAGLADRIEALRSTGSEAAPPIVRVPRGGPLPLSFAQQRLWFIDRLEPGSAVYNMPYALRLRGRLDPAVLGRGLAEIARRHETLRTVFGTMGDEPVQVVRDAASAAVPVADLRGLAAGPREAELLRLAAEEAARPFDLAAGPLLRVAAVRLAEAEWALLFTMHHIVSDGWSAGVLLRELSELYGALAEGRRAELPALPVQYADYAAWQRGWPTGEALEAGIDFWRERLAGAPPLLPLPTDRPRPRVQDPRGARVRAHLPPDVARGVRALARREGATAFIALLAAWQLLLARYAGQDDVSVGTPVAGRTRLETEPLIGFFVNTLVLRTDLSGEPGFRELLGRVRETALGAYQHQEIPFERLVEALAPERSLAHTPLFQVMFVLEAGGRRELRLGGVEVEPLPTGGAEAAKFDLTLDLADDGEGISGWIAYRAGLWERATLERMAGHFARLAGAAVGDPDRPVGEFALATDEERARVLAEWGAAGHGDPGGDCIHDLFAAQARRTPDAVAVVHRGEPTTYAELDRASIRLAHALRARGVGPEARVGVLLRRTPAALVALLGVLRAGGAYVPLDPELPADRVAFMLEEAEVRVVVTESALRGRVPAAVDVLALDAEAASLAREPGDAPETGVSPENLCYLIFTSGSTGRPKGVAVRHRGAVVFLRFLRDVVPAEERASVLGATSLSFDVSVAEVFGTLCWGGKLVLVDNALELPDVADQDVRLVVAVPTAAAELVRAGGIPRSVRAFNLAGEALPAELARALYELGHVRAVRNLYGPTEATVYATWSPVPRGSESVRIGRPVAGARAYVLDPELAPQPVGVPGELYLAGEGLARGYAGRPGLTAERFVPDPFGEPGSRMYRVMDRARWRPDGELEYLGRSDRQVKVRGFRVEPGEVEAALERHARVREAVVVAREDAPGDARLVAYVVPEAGGEPTWAELRAHLAGWLPDYMVPGALVVLDRLPLGVGGKVDRRALPAPRWGAEAAYAAPRTPLEAVLADVFAAVLRRERVGIHDGFFELGGHSLLATRVLSRLRGALGVEVPLRAVFEAPTVAALAGRVEAALRAERSADERIPRRAGGGPSPLSFAQQRLWFIHQLDPGSSAYNMPFALRLRGALDVPALRGSLAELVRRHEAVRTVIVERAGEAVQVVLPAAPVPLPVVDLAGLPDAPRRAEAARRVAGEGRRPFDLARGPLLRVLLVRTAAEEWALCLTMHHVVSDGWSMGVLVREVSALYAAFSRGEASPLPEPELQYADFAAWQRGWLAGPRLEEQLRFWRDRLDGAPPLLDLPTDHPRRGAPGAAETGRPFELAPELTRGLRELGHRENATLFMTLLAAWQALLGRWAGQDDVVVGTAIANRTRAELEGLIGFFVNSLVLRVDLSGDPGFRELLGRVRETTLGAFAHQDLPFERLVEELAPERSLVHNPLFQVMFALQNMELGTPTLGELEMEPLEAADVGAKFDLRVTLSEVGDGIQGQILYRADLFDGSTIERMVEHFRVLLEAAVAEPDRRLRALPLAPAAEREMLVARWSGTGAMAPPERCVHELFAARAAAAPGAVALVHGDRTLTYGELDRRANRLAHLLARRGVGPDVPVGICAERSPEMVVGMLAILKAGGAYVPLDPAYPAGRLAYMLADAAVPLLLTQRRLLEQLPAHAAEVVLLDAPTAGGDDDGDALPPAAAVTPGHLAYVIYTSGSTGRPKGTEVPHRAIPGFFRDVGYARFDADQVLLQHSSPSWDVLTLELWPALLTGGKTVLYPGRTPELAVLGEQVRAHGVTTLWLTSTYFNLVVDSCPEILAGVRQLMVGGEAVSAAHARRALRLHPGLRLVNGYGPSECTVFAACFPVPAAFDAHSVPIGRPVGDRRVYLLDRDLEPAPVGVPGELYVGGPAVARGYRGRPALTAERFVPDPFSGEAGARMYRSGDRVRWRADGEMEFLGRIDQQVKVRGFRIEPGEVEIVLAEHPGVRDAAVVVREGASGEPGDRRLVAYVVPAAGESGAAPEEMHAEYVREWESLFGDTYSGEAAGEAADRAPAFNIAGWNSSYTGEPIPAAEMREWVEDTADALRALRPRRVLEIGCGVGLLLLRLAPECDEYWGADLSPAAIGYLRGQLARPGRELPGVRLLERAADDFGGIPAGHFDLVVINSVVQYFPGADYLLRVLEGAAAALAPGGTLWVGDVRSLPLLEAFHASVELARAGGEVPASALRDRVRRRVAGDKELLVDPEFFRALPRRLPRVAGVEMRLKNGRSGNEMTRFRYDALLRVESAAPPAAPAWRRWDELGSVDAVRRVLDEEAPAALAVARVPNPRVAGALAAVEALDGDAESGTVDELRALAAEREVRAPDPEAFRALAEARGYRARARWAAGGGPGEYDVLLVRGGAAAALPEEVPAAPLPWSAYVSDPLASRRGRWLVPELRAWLRERLPEYMVPGAIVVMEALPLTRNGKVDRRALPAPADAGPDEAYRAPRTDVEEILAGIWAEVLGTERVGVDAGFFDLGGHSLLATQVVSRARQALGLEVPLRMLFEAPTLAALAARIEELRSAGTSAAPPIVRAAREGSEGLPLSFAQQRLWMVDRLQPGSPVYNMPAALRMRGVLDVAALAASLGELVRRHEALRTTLVERGDAAVQVVHPPAPVALPLVDLRGVRDPARHAARLAGEEALRPFDLARGPLLRARLLRLASDDHVLCFTLHHVVGDGWSMDVLVREISALYGAFSRGRASPLPPLPVQYADFAVWQRAWLSGETLEEQVGFWKRALRGAPPLLEVPLDRPRAPGQSPRAGSHRFVLSPEAAEGLRALSLREGATLFMTLLAGWQLLLGRYAGQDDVVVGTPIAGRTRRETEGLIGFFVNMLALRGDLEGDPTCGELVGRVRETALGAYAHQDLPFERLVEELAVERSLAHHPVFQAAFALRRAGGYERLSLGGLELAPFGTGAGPVRFDLELTATDGADGLGGTLLYREALFEAATIARMAGHLEATLEAMAADPLRRVSELSMLRGAERAQLLQASLPTPAEPPREMLHERFARQAERTPHAPAVSIGTQSITYARLDAAADRLAHHLRGRGVGPEARVGVCLDRGIEMVVAVLAVLKAGGAYVPLDPAYPPARLARTLADSGARVLVTQGAPPELLAGFGGEVVRLDAVGDAAGGAPGGAPRSGVGPRNAAYVIYTSGSTGTPKGVVVEHASLAATVLTMRDTFGLGAGEAFLSLASFAFDIWGFEVLAPLVSGGTVRLVAREAVLDVDGLAAELAEVDAVHAVPALMHELVQRVRAGPGVLPRVRHAFVGGDAVPPDLAARMTAVFPGARVWTLYGPTEATIVSAAAPARPEGGHRGHAMGRALPGEGTYVCDAPGSLLPVGVAGELWIGGAGVARGYLGRAELTAEKFVPDPFGGEPGGRLYRTGDRVRRRADGELEFLGRIDQQVKIRGFRIEPGEIEAVLVAQDGVRQAVVAVREDSAFGMPGQKRLVAYLVAEEGARLDPGELRDRVSMQLPAHMVPGACVVLDSIPLTPSGKTDRRALPAPEPGSGTEYAAPETEMEELLCGIWLDVLGAGGEARPGRVGRGDSFFGLGGHSLLAIQVVTRIRRELGIEVPLAALFEAPTLADLATTLEELFILAMDESELEARLDRLELVGGPDAGQ